MILCTRASASRDTALMSASLMPVRAVAAARGVVHDDRECRVAEAELARERRFRHAGHADHVGAVALEAVDLGRGLEPRTLRRGVGPAFDDRLGRLARGLEAAAAAAPRSTAA